MKRLLILGAGQYGLAVKEIADASGEYDIIEFLDDKSDIAVGTMENILAESYDGAVVAVGSAEIRKRLTQSIEPSRLVTVIHPRAHISPSAVVGKGCIVEAGAVLCANTRIGTGTIVMSGAVVGHNSEVGDFCQLKYNSVVPEGKCVPGLTKLDSNEVFKD